MLLQVLSAELDLSEMSSLNLLRLSTEFSVHILFQYSFISQDMEYTLTESISL